MPELWVADLGLIPYDDCLVIQQELVHRRFVSAIEDTLLLLEHEPVVTLGTSANANENFLVPPHVIRRAGIAVSKTDRGGSITYHGPGQLVGYLIFDLRNYGRDVHLFVRRLEEVVIRTLAAFGVVGNTESGLTGVWVGGEKICSIGIAVRKWISYHGFALNVSPSYSHWSMIYPCGLTDRRITSIERHVVPCPTMELVKAAIVSSCASVFNLHPLYFEDITSMEHPGFGTSHTKPGCFNSR